MNVMDELSQVAYDINFMYDKVNRPEFPWLCQCWFHDGGKRRAAFCIGEDWEASAQRTLEDIRGRIVNA